MKGFTLVQLLVVMSIFIILTLIAVPSIRSFQRESDLNNSAEEIINTLRLAQNKTISSEGASQWGVYFSTTTDYHQYTLFKGSDYNSRATSSDETHKLPKSVKIYGINLAGENEVVFARLTGTINQSGSISLELENDPSKTKTVYIENNGQVRLTSLSSPSDTNRIKDSRHVHFDYSWEIVTSTESLVLTFEDSVTETIVIADNLRDGQIYWEREVDVEGEIQKLKIHTHRLNNPDSQFSIHRDRRDNNKTLKIEIPSDSSGFLIDYSADGLITTKASFYATEPDWQ